MGEIAGVLHKDVSDTSRAFVMKLSPEEARAKVLKYMEEDFNRARAEGLRLAEVLERNEAVWASKVRARARACVCMFALWESGGGRALHTCLLFLFQCEE
jgi:hypothetical protein